MLKRSRTALRLLAAAMVLALADGAFAQLAITSVTPSTGPVTGGTTITITGTGLNGDCAPPPLQDPPGCPGTAVFIGGREASFVSASATTITAITSPYVNGRFDVTIFRNTDGARAVARNAFVYGANWERVLLPVFQTADLPGAGDSLWRIESGGYAAIDANVTDMPGSPCLSCVNHVTGPFDPSQLIHTDGHIPGVLVWVASSDPSLVTFNLRARDVSRESETLGTEIRTPSEDDAYGPRAEIVLPNIPLGPSYRAKLRVYQVDAANGRTVRIDVTDHSSGEAISSAFLKLSEEPATPFPAYPGYAELDLPQLNDAERADVLIGTPDEGRFWAFITVTNNSTQQVTTVSPH